ncbi:DUF6261 family protein [Sunxiuqinia sp. A32]|uniref:DUF6261 family protein n=1 Tax=Sunxiuqinia sp. A32 TaxID=3461496 RepID=UPI00404530E1
MIQKLRSTSRTTEVDAVSIRLIGAYRNTSLNTDAHLETIYGSLESESTQLTAAIRRMKAESVLDEKDSVRDQYVRGLFHFVQGSLYHPDDAIKTSAEKVEKVLEQYGISIVSENYATESSLINSLLNDLAKPNLQDDIAALSGCADLIAALQAAQADFEATRIAYEEDKADESTMENASSIKKQVVQIINEQLVIYLQAMNQVDVETYGSFARTVAEIIADNNEVVKKRRKKTEPVE